MVAGWPASVGEWGRRLKPPTEASLLLLRVCVLRVEVIGHFEGIIEVNIGTFTIFEDGEPLLLIVPNRVEWGVVNHSHLYRGGIPRILFFLLGGTNNRA